MNRILLATIAFGLVLLVVSFNYIYVRSTREILLSQANLLSSSSGSTNSIQETDHIWKSRKRLLVFTVPLTAIEKIDMQFSEIHACTQAQDHAAYIRACYALQKLLSDLRG